MLAVYVQADRLCSVCVCVCVFPRCIGPAVAALGGFGRMLLSTGCRGLVSALQAKLVSCNQHIFDGIDWKGRARC